MAIQKPDPAIPTHAPTATPTPTTPPHRITTADELEAIVGRVPDMARLKEVDALDDGCRRVLAASPIAGFGYRDRQGRPHTTIVGGAPGFVSVESPQRISLNLRGLPSDDQDPDPAANSPVPTPTPTPTPTPAPGSGASFVFFLPGVGETLRLNGSVSTCTADRLVITVEEAYVHCAKSVLRSGLWRNPRPTPAAEPPPQTTPAAPTAPTNAPTKENAPLTDPAVETLLASAPFLVVSSWGTGGTSDTSPRGDTPGFAHILDGSTLAIPDRKGNQRTDTFHNLLADETVSVVVLVPGRSDVLHLSGTAYLTDEPSLLERLTSSGQAPHAALLVNVQHAHVQVNDALEAAQVWERSAHVDRATVPDLMGLAAQHLAANQSGGAKGTVARLLGKPLLAFPNLTRRMIDLGYRRQLRDEGLAETDQGQPSRPARPSLRAAALLGHLPPALGQGVQRLSRALSDSLARLADTLEEAAQANSAPGATGTSATPRTPSTPATSLKTTPRHPRDVRVTDVIRETADAVTLVLEDATGAPFEFKPGQYFTVGVPDVTGVSPASRYVRRSYSASSAPGSTRLTLTVKRVQGGLCSVHLNEAAKVGDRFQLHGPSGDFCVANPGSVGPELVLLAGGSGITPVMSIIRTVLATTAATRLTLLYGNRAEPDIIFAESLAALRAEHPDRLTVRHVLADPPESWTGGTGLLTPETLRRELTALAPSPQAHFFTCGPEPMLAGVRETLAALGVTPDRTHEERFAQPPAAAEPAASGTDHAAEPPQPTMTVRNGPENLGTADAAPGQSLLEAGLDADLPMPFSCTAGNCGECRVKLLSGDVEMSQPNCLTKQQRAQGYVLTCVSRSLAPTTIDISDPGPA